MASNLRIGRLIEVCQQFYRKIKFLISSILGISSAWVLPGVRCPYQETSEFRPTPKGICTVRFAADEEFIGLARDAAEKGRVPDEIKRAHSPGAPGTFRV